MVIADLVKALGYEESPNFIQGSGLEEVPSYSYVFRRAKATCHLHGVYTLSEKEPGKGWRHGCSPSVRLRGHR